MRGTEIRAKAPFHKGGFLFDSLRYKKNFKKLKKHLQFIKD